MEFFRCLLKIISFRLYTSEESQQNENHLKFRNCEKKLQSFKQQKKEFPFEKTKQKKNTPYIPRRQASIFFIYFAIFLLTNMRQRV